MKKKLIISVILIVLIIFIVILKFLFYFDFFEMHKGEKARGIARDFYAITNNLFIDEDIYNNIEDSFTLSSIDKYSNNSDTIDNFKKELESEIKNFGDKDIIEYEYYIEIKDKSVSKIICSKSKYISIVGFFGPETVHHEGDEPVRNFMDEIKKSYESFGYKNK